jgi:hypothetical protein
MMRYKKHLLLPENGRVARFREDGRQDILTRDGFSVEAGKRWEHWRTVGQIALVRKARA